MAYSVVQYTGDGVTTSFAVPYPFVSRDHITAKVNGVSKTISWINDGLIQLSPAPAVDASIIISRDTSRNVPLVDFQDAQVLTEADLDMATLQNLYVAQEAFDASDSSEIAAEVQANANAAAASALEAANSATSASASAVAAEGFAADALDSANDAAASAASIGNVIFYDVSDQTVAPVFSLNIPLPETVADHDAAQGPLGGGAMFFGVGGPSVMDVPVDRTLAPMQFTGTYKLNSGATVAPFFVSIATDTASDPTTEATAVRSSIEARAAHTVYGVRSTVKSRIGGTSLYPVYIRAEIDHDIGAGSAGGDLFTIEVASAGVDIFNGNGIVLKGTGTAPFLTYGIDIQENVNVGAAVIHHVAYPSSSSDLIQFSKQGESADSRFAVDGNGSLVFGDWLGQRILGDFSNSLHVARVMFGDKSERMGVAPGDADVFVGARPSGVATASGFNVYGADDPDDTHYASFNTGIVANTIGINSSHTGGTAITRPFVFSFDGTEKVRVSKLGNIGINSVANDSWSDTIAFLEVKGRSAGALIRMTDSTEATQVHMFTDINGFSFAALGPQRLSFSTDSTERFQVTGAGRILVNGATDDTVNKLQVAGGTRSTNVVFDAVTNDGNSGTAKTINFGAGQYHTLSMTGNCTFTFTAPAGPCVVQLELTQSSGSHTMALPASVKWPAVYTASDKLLSTAAGARDLLILRWNGTDYVANLIKGIA